MFFGNGYVSARAPRFISSGVVYTNGAQSLTLGVMSATQNNVYVNGASKASNVNITASLPSYTNTVLTIGNNYINEGFKGNIQEIIFWGSDQNSNVSGINTNTNTYYAIY